MTRREALLFRSFAVWTIYVWVTRMWVIARDHAPGHGLGFKLVHAVLAIISCAFAIAALMIVARIRKRRPVEATL
jgi:TRAP-type C4-dicarboxylate transport system permease small subunit